MRRNSSSSQDFSSIEKGQIEHASNIKLEKTCINHKKQLISDYQLLMKNCDISTPEYASKMNFISTLIPSYFEEYDSNHQIDGA